MQIYILSFIFLITYHSIKNKEIEKYKQDLAKRFILPRENGDSKASAAGIGG